MMMVVCETAVSMLRCYGDRPACAIHHHPPHYHHLQEMEGDSEYESLPESSGPLVHMFAGSLAGMAEHTVMFPVDVVKVG